MSANRVLRVGCLLGIFYVIAAGLGASSYHTPAPMLVGLGAVVLVTVVVAIAVASYNAGRSRDD